MNSETVVLATYATNSVDCLKQPEAMKNCGSRINNIMSIDMDRYRDNKSHTDFTDAENKILYNNYIHSQMGVDTSEFSIIIIAFHLTNKQTVFYA